MTQTELFRIWWAMGQCRVGPCLMKTRPRPKTKLPKLVEIVPDMYHRGPAPLDSYPENYLHSDISS